MSLARTVEATLIPARVLVSELATTKMRSRTLVGSAAVRPETIAGNIDNEISAGYTVPSLVTPIDYGQLGTLSNCKQVVAISSSEG